MGVTFTFVPTNNIGKVRSFIQDTEVSNLLSRVVASGQWGRKLLFNGVNFEDNEYVGQWLFPDIASSYNNYKVIENTCSSITIRGDFSDTIASTGGTSAIINDAIFSDQEINNFLSIGNNDILKSSAIGLRALASNKAKLAKKFKKDGIGGIEIEQRALKDLIALAESFEAQANKLPSGGLVSYELGYGKRADDFQSNDVDLLGCDVNEYLTQ